VGVERRVRKERGKGESPVAGSLARHKIGHDIKLERAQTHINGDGHVGTSMEGTVYSVSSAQSQTTQRITTFGEQAPVYVRHASVSSISVSERSETHVDDGEPVSEYLAVHDNLTGGHQRQRQRNKERGAEHAARGCGG
jgi:hypothetical protein